MQGSPDIPYKETQWDQMLAKYVHVWLWSILVGATTGIGLSGLSLSYPAKWGILGIGLIAASGLAIACVLASLYALSRFLIGYLLPVFFASAPVSREDMLKAGRRLAQSLQFLIFAIIIRFIIYAAEMLLVSVGRF